MSTFSKWIIDSEEGNIVGPIAIPEGGNIVAIQVREQGGYGVVNVRLGTIISHQITYSDWVCGNHNGVAKTAQVLNAKATGIAAYVQGGYGVVDIGIIFENGAIKWCTGNHQGDNYSIMFKVNTLIGIECREQGGFGIVNLRCEEK